MDYRLSSRVTRTVWLVGFLVALLPLSPNDKDKIDGDLLLDPAHIVEIRIVMPTKDWDTLKAQRPNGAQFFGGGPSESSYSYFEGDIWIDERKIESVGIRKKGFFGSNDAQRPSLKIKFDEFKKANPIKGLSRLTLNNNKQDRSLVNQLLAYQLFQRAGIRAPRSNCARVTVNGSYLGIYSNVESIKKPFLKRNFGNRIGQLYEATITDFHSRTIGKIDAKTNKAENNRKKLEQLANVLAEPGDLDLKELDEIIDVDNFIRYWAVESLIGFWDGYNSNQNNYYIYFPPKTGKGVFIPWGADWVFTTNGPFSRFERGTTSVYAQSIIAKRLYHTSGIPERYHAAMKSILRDAWNEEKMLHQIDVYEKRLAPHLGKTQQQTRASMNDVREFIRNRKQDVIEQLAAGTVRISDSPRKPMYTVSIGNAAGKFSSRWEEKAPNVSNSIELTLNGNDVEFKSFSVEVQPFVFPQFGRSGRAGFGGGRIPGVSDADQKFTPPVLLKLTGTRDGSPPMVISLVVDRAKFQTGKPIAVRGQWFERQPGNQTRGFGGGRFGGGTANRSVAGSLNLQSFGFEKGNAISGEFSFEITETHGTMFGDR